MSKILALLRASLVKVEYTKEKGRQTLILFICFNHVTKRQFVYEPSNGRQAILENPFAEASPSLLSYPSEIDNYDMFNFL